MSFETRVCGLKLSSNQLLPGLFEVCDVEPVDIQLEFCDGPLSNVPEMSDVDWCSQPLIETADGSHRVYSGDSSEGRFWRLWYGSNSLCQSLEFVIHPTGRRLWALREVWGNQRERIDLQDVTTLLLGSVLNIVLRLRGVICLHGSVVAVGSSAVVILGHKGMGKSSMAAALAQRGHAVLSDDVAAITKHGGTYMAQPGYPRLRLWPATLNALQVDADLTPVLATANKFYIDLNDIDGDTRRRFQSQPLPVGAIYLLTRDSGRTAPSIERVAAADRLATLLEQTSVRFMPLDNSQRTQEFAQLSSLAAAVPILRIRSPEGLDHVPAQCAAIANTAVNSALSAV